MHHFMKVCVVGFLVLLGGCASVNQCVEERTTGVLAGTNTAVIGIALNEQGVPVIKYDEVVVAPGQKVLFVGPDEFSVIFKNKKSPIREIEKKSVNGVVVINVPEAIFKQPEFVDEYQETGQLKFSYGVLAYGKELDPIFIIKK